MRREEQKMKEGKEEKTEKKRRYSTSTYKKEREEKATWCLTYQTFCSLNIDYHQLLSVVLQPLLLRRREGIKSNFDLNTLHEISCIA